MCHHLIILVKSEVRSNGPDIFESETELNKMKKKKNKVLLSGVSEIRSQHLSHSYNLSIKPVSILEMSLFTHKTILIMAILAFMGKVFPGQKLHLHTILKPNWAKSEAPLKICHNMPRAEMNHFHAACPKLCSCNH